MNPDNVDPRVRDRWDVTPNRAPAVKRRAKNRVARKSRRVNRLRGAA